MATCREVIVTHTKHTLIVCYDNDMNVLFIADFGLNITDIEASRNLYIDTLSLPLKEENDHYFHSEDIKGVKHFALWPLSRAAESCFDSTEWSKDILTPTSWIEFNV